MTPPVDFSFTALFLQATPLVQGVLILLLACSLGGWAIILEKAWLLRRLGRQVQCFEALADQGLLEAGTDSGPLCQALIRAGREELHHGPAGEGEGERRQRLAEAMGESLGAFWLVAERRLPYLANIGAAAPFIGLFGTVWGVMHAFTGIALAQDTRLATVAPGIAEALSTTAIGLLAAIPAAVAYNKQAADLGRLARRLGLAIGRLARRAELPRRQPVRSAA